MKNIVSLLLIFIFLFFTGLTSASYWFQVIDVSPISMESNSDENFTVTVKGLGSEGAYVQVVFRNMSEGLSIASSDRLRYVFPAGTTRFNFTMRAGDIAPGNYSFEVGTVGKSSLPGWKKAYVDVVNGGNVETDVMLPPGNETAQHNISEAPAVLAEAANASEGPMQSTPPSTQSQERGMPGPGAALAIAALLLMGRKLKR